MRRMEQLFPSQSSQPCAWGKVSYIGFMMIPSEVPVMTLPNATLFPQALLPLYIFEPRYRQMLVDMLHSHRMFSVASLSLVVSQMKWALARCSRFLSCSRKLD